MTAVLTVANLILYFCTLIFVLAVVFAGSYLVMAEQAKKIKEVNFIPSDVKSAGGLVKIAFITDLHFPLMPYDSGELVRRISSADCDCVLIGGDLCQNEKGKNQMLGFMRSLSENVDVPIYVVLGNHDNFAVCGLDADKIKAYTDSVESCGDNIKVLSNQRVFIELSSGKTVLIGGLKDARVIDKEEAKCLVESWNIEAAERGAEVVLLTHNPDATTFLPDNCCNIILCGHTHGGQVYMPFNLEFKLLRKDILPKKGYKYGLCNYEGKNRLYISSGAGCSFMPIRFRTTAEIVYVHI